MAEYPLEVLQEIPASKSMSTGTKMFMLEAGKRLKIETSPDGLELFNEKVPNKKAWRVTVKVEVTEMEEDQV